MQLKTKEITYKNEEFIIKKFKYDLQFFPYYNARFNAMAGRILLCRDICCAPLLFNTALLCLESVRKQATISWPTTPIHDMSDLATNEEDEEEDEHMKNGGSSQGSDSKRSHIDLEILNGKVVVVLGTLFKKMPNQPNILKEVDAEKKLLSLKHADEEVTNFVSKEDRMYLQAGNETMELKGEELKMDKLCTGICVAVKGHINQHGSGFIVEDICHVAIDEVERPLKPVDYYVVIASGLGFSMDMAKNDLLSSSLNLLFELLVGNSILSKDKQITNFIIAGNCIGKNARDEEKDANEEDKLTPLWNKKVQSFTVDAVKLLDKFLCTVGQFLSVDIMPGVLDPCNTLWPQQPMHPCLFPNAYRLDSVLSVTNPHRASYFGVEFFGTSGQNVDTLRSCTALSESTEIMRHLMEWGHIAPTCPDTLPCYPYSTKDPFVLTSYPDIFFAGNQPEFSATSFETPAGKKVQLLAVPAFEDSRIVAMVNLRTLKCEMMAFNWSCQLINLLNYPWV